MISKFENTSTLVTPEVLEEFCQQMLRSEPVIIQATEEDEWIGHIGAWFDAHDEFLGDLCATTCDGYCVITWDPW